jgi:hypothetical protein
MTPPMRDFTSALQELALAGAKVAPHVEAEARRIVTEAIVGRPEVQSEQGLAAPSIQVDQGLST